MHADAPERLVVDVRLDVRGRLGVDARRHRVLVIVANRDRDAERLRERVDESRERTVALALDHPLLAVDPDAGRDLVEVLLARVGVGDELVRPDVLEVAAR